MAGGESQLCVVVADRLLSDFTGVVVFAHIKEMVMAHIRTGSHTEFVVCGDIQISMIIHRSGVKLLPYAA